MNNTHRVMCQICVTIIAVISADQQPHSSYITSCK